MYHSAVAIVSAPGGEQLPRSCHGPCHHDVSGMLRVLPQLVEDSTAGEQHGCEAPRRCTPGEFKLSHQDTRERRTLPDREACHRDNPCQPGRAAHIPASSHQLGKVPRESDKHRVQCQLSFAIVCSTRQEVARIIASGAVHETVDCYKCSSP